ncbi:hypothetical protein SAMN04487905_12012 [Actinopolyspora xinjiangensis]|uniref:Immunity protein 21 n=1 Tax=Actinopolyspora xinjiangensis TaxID=405564 RepID=A0A1H0X025_9ACTN|nr:hypothetical protein [Actinopolyspora xinjiangensis]SDP96344.1 hypothetical protein SAMN04487905_12012 [Actinopolyspora xinjiangensis]
MARLLAATDLVVTVDHHLFGIVDQACEQDRTDPPQAPSELGQWMSVGVAAVYVEAEQDIITAGLRLECWDGPAPFEERDWPRSELAVVRMPSGRLGIDEIAAGGQGDVFVLPEPGEYQLRVAWRERDLDQHDEDGNPEAFALVQYWPRC